MKKEEFTKLEEDLSKQLFESKRGYDKDKMSELFSEASLFDLVTVPIKELYVYLSSLFTDNNKKLSSFLYRGDNIMQFPLLASDKFGPDIIGRFCGMLQIEKAENIRSFFYNHSFFLAKPPSELKKEFSSKYFEEAETLLNVYKSQNITDPYILVENNALLTLELKALEEKYSAKSSGLYLTESFSDYTSYITEKFNSLNQKLLEDDSFGGNSRGFNPSQVGGVVYKNNIKFSKSAMQPIAPTMVNVEINLKAKKKVYQIIGVRYIPQTLNFQEMLIAFKNGFNNSTIVSRFLQYLNNNITFADFLLNRDKAALNRELTKISCGDKSWAEGLKQSTQAVSVLVTQAEFDELCDNVINLNNPQAFKHFEKHIGLLDLIIMDIEAKSFTRINARDNYSKIRYDAKKELAPENRDIVIKTKIDYSKLRDEDSDD